MNRQQKLERLEELCKNQDWYYQMAEGTAWSSGRDSMNEIWKLKEELGADGEVIYAKYYQSCWK